MVKKVPQRDALLTELDNRTVGDIDQAIKVLNEKIEKGKLSEKTRKSTEKQVKRLQVQKEKTLKLFRKYKKDSRLKSLSDSTVSVRKIWTALGRNTDQITTDKQNVMNWIFKNGAENGVAMLGGAISMSGLLALKVGEKGAEKAVIAHIGSFLFETVPGWIVANPAAAAGLGGAAVIAGVIAKKAIRRKLEQNAAAKQEAENEMNKGTAYDHEHVASSATNAAAFKKLVASATTDLSTFEYLSEVAMNPNNDPATITQANKILSAARAQIKANETQALQALLVTAMGSADCVEAISKYAAYEEIRKLSDKSKQPPKAEPTPGETVFAVTSIPEIIDLKTAYDAMKSGNLEAISKLVGSKGATEFVESIIGPSATPKAGIAAADYTTFSTELTEMYQLLSAKKHNQEINNAKKELKDRELAGEFKITGDELEIDGSKYDLNDETNDLNGLSEYREAIEKACKAIDINKDNAGNELDGEQLCHKYSVLIEAGKAGILAERNAARTGMVK